MQLQEKMFSLFLMLKSDCLSDLLRTLPPLGTRRGKTQSCLLSSCLLSPTLLPLLAHVLVTSCWRGAARSPPLCSHGSGDWAGEPCTCSLLLTLQPSDVNPRAFPCQSVRCTCGLNPDHSPIEPFELPGFPQLCVLIHKWANCSFEGHWALTTVSSLAGRPSRND